MFFKNKAAHNAEDEIEMKLYILRFLLWCCTSTTIIFVVLQVFILSKFLRLAGAFNNIVIYRKGVSNIRYVYVHPLALN